MVQSGSTSPTATNCNIVNLSEYTLTSEEEDLLLKGLTFCPNSKPDKFEIEKDLQLFTRKLLFKSMYAKLDEIDTRSLTEERALNDLVTLLEEQENLDLIDQYDIESMLQEQSTTKENIQLQVPKMPKKSDKFLNPNQNPNIGAFLAMTLRDIRQLKIKREQDNLTGTE